MSEVYRSLYWRISFAFIVFVAAMFVAQSLIFAWMFNRSVAAMPGGSPNAFAAIVANDIAATLARDPNIELQRHVEREYGRIISPMFVIMKDGRAAGNLSEAPSEIVRDTADAAMGIAGARGAPAAVVPKGPPMVSAPIEIDLELRGVRASVPMPMSLWQILTGSSRSSTTWSQMRCYLSVSDSGDGIPPEHLPYVFDRFYKVGASRQSAQAGSGLGLSIAKAIVERHGGSIVVDSVAGRTTFTIGLASQ